MATYFTGNGITATADNAARSMVAASNCYENNGGGGSDGGSLVY